MVKVKQTEKVKKERNSSSCANREDVSVLRDLRTTYVHIELREDSAHLPLLLQFYTESSQLPTNYIKFQNTL